MLTLLLVALFCTTLFLNFRLYEPKAPHREAFLYTLLTIGGFAWLYVEGFSFYNAINVHTARVYWTCVALASLVNVIYCRRDLPAITNQLFLRVSTIVSNYKVVFCIGGLMAIMLFGIALIAPPNNYDANNYHMHRVMAWMNNGNVEFYPTLYIQQLYLNVFSEYLILNLHLLNDSDLLVNLVQYTYGWGVVVALTLIAKILGLNRTVQLWLVLLCITLPIWVFEMTTTQVELVMTFFLLSFIYIGFRLVYRYSVFLVLGMGVALALSVFTKYPAGLYAAPFCVYFGIAFIKRYGWGKSIGIAFILGSIFLIVFFPFWQRNYALFGDLLAPKGVNGFYGEVLNISTFSIPFLISNIVKNLSLHMGLPVEAYNALVGQVIHQLHDVLQVHVNEPMISRDDFYIKYMVHEDTIPNSLHFTLLLLAYAIVPFTRHFSKVKTLYFLTLLGFVLFCLLLKFQHWSTRTQMPFFLLSCILIAYWMGNWRGIYNRLLGVVIVVVALFFTLGNPCKLVLPIPFYTKKAVGYLPANICIPVADKARYKEVLAPYYDFNENEAGCFSLKNNMPYAERLVAFELLDEVGYFEKWKKTILNTDREELYFVNIYHRYKDFKAIVDVLKEGDKVAYLTEKNEGFYFYPAAFSAMRNEKAVFDYLVAPKGYTVLPNAKKDFCYNYVVTDDMALIDKYIEKRHIKELLNTDGELIIVVLEMEICNRHYVDFL